ncbi:hypothetical protein ATO6_01800 [Oceanicola sp. 22II-s10i]|nr:hypothetical protein ATO6_01800 [Oceanicola sp. 22II-s10i]
MGWLERLREWERRWRYGYRTDFSTPEDRRRAEIYIRWFDHGILRGRWTNGAEIAPGVFRSNQPTRARYAAMKAAGVRSVLNLRGDEGDGPPLLMAREACAALRLHHVVAHLPGRRAPAAEDILSLIAIFRDIERPFFMHCKSGADRSGFAAAIYLMTCEGRSPAEARRQLSARHLHFARSRAGVLGLILDRHAASGLPLETWLRKDYDPQAIQAEFDQRRRQR